MNKNEKKFTEDSLKLKEILDQLYDSYIVLGTGTINKKSGAFNAIAEIQTMEEFLFLFNTLFKQDERFFRQIKEAINFHEFYKEQNNEE